MSSHLAAGRTASSPAAVPPTATPRRRPARAVAHRGWRRAVISPGAAVGVLTVVALAVRLGIDRSLWLDEAITVQQVSQPFGDMITQVTTGDVQPPLFHAVAWVAVRLLGTSELALRTPSIVAGTALVPLLYATGRQLYSRRTGLVAGALATLAPLAVWYSTEARMYALYMLFGVAAVYFQVRAIRHGRFWEWAGFVGSTVALLWTHYLGGLLVVGQQAAFAVVVVRRWGRSRPVAGLVGGWLAAAVVIAVGVLPVVGIAWEQAAGFALRQGGTLAGSPQHGAPAAGGPSPSVYLVGPNPVWALSGYHPAGTMTRLGMLWPLLVPAVAFLFFEPEPWRSSTLLLVGLVTVEILGGLALTLYNPKFFEIRYVIVVVPLLLLLVARTVTAAARSPRAMAAVAGLLLVAFGVGLVDQQVNDSNPYLFDFRQALTAIEQRATPGDVVVYEPDYLWWPVRYYAPGLATRPLDDGLVYPRRHGQVFLLTSPLFVRKEGDQAQVDRALAQLNSQATLAEKLSGANVETWVFR